MPINSCAMEANRFFPLYSRISAEEFSKKQLSNGKVDLSDKQLALLVINFLEKNYPHSVAFFKRMEAYAIKKEDKTAVYQVTLFAIKFLKENFSDGIEFFNQLEDLAMGMEKWDQKLAVLTQDTNDLKQSIEVLQQHSDDLDRETNALKQSVAVLRQNTDSLSQEIRACIDATQSKPALDLSEVGLEAEDLESEFTPTVSLSYAEVTYLANEEKQNEAFELGHESIDLESRLLEPNGVAFEVEQQSSHTLSQAPICVTDPLVQAKSDSEIEEKRDLSSVLSTKPIADLNHDGEVMVQPSFLNESGVMGEPESRKDSSESTIQIALEESKTTASQLSFTSVQPAPTTLSNPIDIQAQPPSAISSSITPSPTVSLYGKTLAMLQSMAAIFFWSPLTGITNVFRKLFWGTNS